MSQMSYILARASIDPNINNDENYYNVIDTRLNCVIYSLNNYNDAEEIKNSLNRIHTIYARNNNNYHSLFNSETPYNIEVIRRVNN